MTRLKERSAEKALAALGEVADQRAALPEAEADAALSAAAGGGVTCFFLALLSSAVRSCAAGCRAGSDSGGGLLVFARLRPFALLFRTLRLIKYSAGVS